MKFWKPFNYSLCIALVLTSLSFFFERGDYFRFPGVVIEMILTWLILLIPTGDYYFVFPDWAHIFFNIGFLLSLSFIAFQLLISTRNRQ